MVLLRAFALTKIWVFDLTMSPAPNRWFAGSSLDRARVIFADFVRKRPRARLTIRQRTRVLQRWPK